MCVCVFTSLFNLSTFAWHDIVPLIMFAYVFIEGNYAFPKEDQRGIWCRRRRRRILGLGDDMKPLEDVYPGLQVPRLAISVHAWSVKRNLNK